MVRVLVVVPLDEEMQHIHGYLSGTVPGGNPRAKPRQPFSTGRENYTFEYYHKRTGHPIELAFHVIGDAGNLRAAIKTMAMIKNLDPNICILTGIAGSLHPDVRLGDVALATGVRAIAPDKIKKMDQTTEEFAANPQAVGSFGRRIHLDPRKKFLSDSFYRFRRSAIELHNNHLVDDYLASLDAAKVNVLKLKGVENLPALDPAHANVKPRVFGSSIFGSDMVVDSAEFVDFLQDRNRDTTLSNDYYTLRGNPAEAHKRNKWLNAELQVVDMETLGVYFLADMMYQREGPRFYSVRGISDFSSEKNANAVLQLQIREIAMLNAIAVVVDLAEYLIDRARAYP